MSRAVARAALVAVGTSGALLVPAAAEACAVCGGGDPAAKQLAFLIGTGLLSLLPLALIGGVVLVLRRRARAIAAAEAARAAARGRPAPAPPAAGGSLRRLQRRASSAAR